MRYLFILSILFTFQLSCRKKCEQRGQFEIPLNVTITNVPSVKLKYDTISVIVTLPFKNNDIRLPTISVNTEYKQPSTCYFTMSAIPSNGVPPIPPIIPFQDGYFDVLVIKGKRLKYLYFDFQKSDSAWEVNFKLIPKRQFDGLFFLRWSRIEYKDICLQLDPITFLVNTPKSHHLIKERLDFPLSPWVNDVFFYIE